ncbi:immunoglobulin-like domain-containing protein [Lederbergia panacisoli]|uniref:immunoglobulin-like domain-containing protein n=1 Tax=Lederbergia panacisoli TaxID=1255251 RepID=UPI00214BD0F3|nr:immunoglobulin-like domain-containing protein [Lederbergia panacisoli]MCR2822787.1 leucine-rich repeat protein [Lederbergia panacisoli]
MKLTQLGGIILVKLKNYLNAVCFLLICCFSVPSITAADSDTIKPTISNATNKTVYIGTSFNPLSGVTAKDNVDGNITKSIKVTGSVNMKKAGKYKLTYTVSDKAKNKATVVRTITVKKDTVKPTISGTSNKTVYIGTSFNPKSGVTAKDNVDGNITKNIKVTGSVNMKKAGKYKLTYTVSDKARNKATVVRTITVKKDTVKPTISGTSNKTVYIGTSFNPKSGVTAKDNVNGNITKNIKVTGSVNMKKVGKYKLTYTVSDKAKNKATVVRTITVKKDTVKPVFSGVANKTIYAGQTFNARAGVTAKDNVSGDLTRKVKIINTVNTYIPGTYTLTYTVEDQAKNKATVKRKITVKPDTEAPVISGVRNITIELGTKFNVLAGVTAYDKQAGNLTSKILVEGKVDSNKTGVYFLQYRVYDNFGNEGYASRSVTVIKHITSLKIQSPTPDDIIEKDEVIQMVAGISPSNATNKEIEWSVENITGKASIDRRDGYLYAKSAGTVKVMAKTTDGSLKTASKTLVISDFLRINGYIGTNSKIDIPTIVFQKDQLADGSYNGILFDSNLVSKGIGKVTAISGNVFNDKNLESVTIPDTVQLIGRNAFKSNRLTEIKLPDNVEYLGSYAFENNQLNKLQIGKGLTAIPEFAFRNNLLTELTLPSNITSIEQYAFAHNSIEKFEFPVQISVIEDSVFYNNNIKSLEIPNHVKSIGSSAFSRNQISNLKIGNGLTEIKYGVFANNAIQNLEIPNNIKSIGDSAFVSNDIRSLKLAVGLQKIGKNSFNNNRLTSVEIPETVNTIDDGAFENNELVSVNIPKEVTRIEDYVFYQNYLTHIVIPDSVKSIGYSAFYKNELSNVIISSNVERIDPRAFYGNKLTNIKLPTKLVSIGSYAYGSNKLQSITIPKGVKTIEDSAFSNNPLTSITIGEGVTIGKDLISSRNNAFRDAYELGGAGTYHLVNGEWIKIDSF